MPLESPTLAYRYDLQREIAALKRHRREGLGQRIPERAAGRLLIASWNIARLGGNRRLDSDYELLATMLAWFDLVALQEVRDNLAGLRSVQARMPSRFRVVFSDEAGNSERMAFLYDSARVALLEEVGEIGFTPRELASIRQSDVGAAFDSFDRTPHLAAFQAGEARFLLVNVHLYFGSARGRTGLARRAAEAFAVASWAKRRQREKYAYTRHVLAVGDFNLPKVDPEDEIYRALTARGLLLPADAATRIGTNLEGSKQYDQVVFLPEVGAGLLESGVFDFDSALFQDRDLRARRPILRYRISDHRILWFVLATDQPKPSFPRVTRVRPATRTVEAAMAPWGTLVRPGPWMRQ